MIRHVLYLGSAAPENDGAWRGALEAAGFALLESSTPEQAALYLKSYPLLALLVDARADAAAAAEAARTLGAAETAGPRPLCLALAGASAAEAGLAALAAAGVEWIWIDSMPAELLLHPLRAAQQLGALASAAQPGAGAADLARETRRLLHDLCQPLSALQGRVQLMAARCSEDDPLKEQMKNLASLSLEMSKYVREIQELQRKHS